MPFESSILPELDSPVTHFAGAVPSHLISEVEEVLSAETFKPLHHKGEVTRYQKPLNSDKFKLLERVTSVLSEISTALHADESTDTELYAFRYVTGQGVPEHQDKRRHVASLMIYAGDYDGGEFVYETQNGDSTEETVVPLQRGDALLLVNESESGAWQNPTHHVREVRRGERFVVAGSLVRVES